MSHNFVRYTICSLLSWHYYTLIFSPSTVAAICQILLFIFLLHLETFEFIEIMLDILSLVILFSPMGLHLSLYQSFSNVYLQTISPVFYIMYSFWSITGLSNLISLSLKFWSSLFPGVLVWWYQKTRNYLWHLFVPVNIKPCV